MKAEYLCPVLTLFDSDKSVDLDGMHLLYDRLIAGGIAGIVVLGSTGEFYGMSYCESSKLALDAIQYVGKRSRVIIGTCRPVVEETIDFSNKVLAAGADGVIILPPYYIGASEEGCYEYFHKVAGEISGPILIYNYPERTGCDITVSILKKLLREHKNIVGIKDTVESVSHTQEIIKKIKEDYQDFKVYSGYDNNFLPTVFSGGEGCIAAISNVCPDICASWIKAVETENLKQMIEIHKKILSLMDLYAVTKPFMPGMKKMLQLQGVTISGTSLLPAVDVDEQACEVIKNILSKI